MKLFLLLLALTLTGCEDMEDTWREAVLSTGEEMTAKCQGPVTITKRMSINPFFSSVAISLSCTHPQGQSFDLEG